MLYGYRITGEFRVIGYRYATSPDGVTWTKQGAGDAFSSLPFAPEWHQLLKIGSVYHLFYEVDSGPEGRFLIRHATAIAADGPYS